MMRKRWVRPVAFGVAAVLIIAGFITWYFRSSHTRLTTIPPGGPVPVAGRRVPRFAHLVVVIDENKSLTNIVGDDDAPFLNSLVPHAALFTRSYGVAHPSQPNYFALFAGRTDAGGDGCDVPDIPVDAPNLGAALLRAHRTFVGYAEGLPSTGFAGCGTGDYARKHAPWTHFSAIPAADQRPFSTLGNRYDALPTVAFVIPDLQNDMHSGSVKHGDAWLRRNIGPLIAWAMHHDTLIVITWDESSAPITNQIPTFFVGPMVKPGRYDEVVSHYTVLRTIEDAYGLPHAGASADGGPILDCWTATRPSSRPQAR